jgi:beta-glucosidase
MVPLLAPYVDGWAPINEYNFYSGAPNQPEDFRRLANYAFNLLIADAACYDIAKAHSQAPCASPMAYLALQPRRAHDVFDRTMADFADWCANGWYYHAIRTGELVYPFHDGRWLPSVKGRADHWAVNMYARDLVDARAKNARGPRYRHRALRINASHRDNAWEFSPDELLHNMMRLRDKPVVITENGCNSDDDRFRIVSIALHLAMAREALDQGLDLRGYLHWSLFDNYEWGSWAPKYGLVGFDPATFARQPRPSALLLRDVIRENAISGEIVRRHLDRHPSMADG